MVPPSSALRFSIKFPVNLTILSCTQDYGFLTFTGFSSNFYGASPPYSGLRSPVNLTVLSRTQDYGFLTFTGFSSNFYGAPPSSGLRFSRNFYGFFLAAELPVFSRKINGKFFTVRVISGRSRLMLALSAAYTRPSVWILV